MRRLAGSWRGGLLLLGCFSSAWLAHLAISGDGNGIWRWALLALPLLALACWAYARSARKSWWLAVLLLAGAGIYLLERRGNLGMAAAYGVPHAVANGFLLWWFSRTLQGGREPLITRVARRIHGTLSPPIEYYTRQVTIAWCVFFAAQVAVSLVLFVFAPLETWSMFVNVLNLPLLVLMFAGEYLVRVIRHPDHPRVSVTSMLRAFAKDDSVSAGAKAP
jgi:uncharacterized membrane protein